MIEKESFYLLHQTLYFLVAFSAILLSIRVLVKNEINKSSFFSSNFLLLLIITCFTLIVGLRAYNVGTDTINYYFAWNRYNLGDATGDLLYYYLMFGVKSLGYSYQVFLFLDALIFFVLLYFSIKHLSKVFNIHQFLLLFAFLSFFFALTLSINVVRQGDSLMLMLFAYSLYLQGKPKKYVYLCLLGAVLFHLPSLIPIGAFLIVKYFKKITFNFWVAFYFFGLTLSYFNYGIINISPYLAELLEGDKRIMYIIFEETDYEIDFRPQFAVFNTVFLFIGLYNLKSFKNSEWFDTLLKYYILTSVLFFMAFQIPYSDRWGLYSWIAIPLIIGQAFSKKYPKRYTYLIQTLFLISIYIYFNFYD
jgi:hypothetical protein